VRPLMATAGMVRGKRYDMAGECTAKGESG
jgi:hypothetical protein